MLFSAISNETWPKPLYERAMFVKDPARFRGQCSDFASTAANPGDQLRLALETGWRSEILTGGEWMIASQIAAIMGDLTDG
jgi:hypothetical protein